ncbi:hypothetical protein, partial [Actinomyces sp.]|uniref:hypothetical protein n=1 Tax=Actinomyces sp. TaxID=29317 RepID=UPI00289893FB
MLAIATPLIRGDVAATVPSVVLLSRHAVRRIPVPGVLVCRPLVHRGTIHSTAVHRDVTHRAAIRRSHVRRAGPCRCARRTWGTGG